MDWRLMENFLHKASTRTCNLFIWLSVTREVMPSATMQMRIVWPLPYQPPPGMADRCFSHFSVGCI